MEIEFTPIIGIFPTFSSPRLVVHRSPRPLLNVWKIGQYFPQSPPKIRRIPGERKGMEGYHQPLSTAFLHIDAHVGCTSPKNLDDILPSKEGVWGVHHWVLAQDGIRIFDGQSLDTPWVMPCWIVTVCFGCRPETPESYGFQSRQRDWSFD